SPLRCDMTASVAGAATCDCAVWHIPACADPLRSTPWNRPTPWKRLTTTKVTDEPGMARRRRRHPRHRRVAGHAAPRTRRAIGAGIRQRTMGGREPCVAHVGPALVTVRAVRI